MSISIYQFEVITIDGEKISLSKYIGKTLLIVNVASFCGFTSQYAELEELYLKYKDQGLEILAFPCNQFKGQEPQDEKEIKTFCELNYKISFPLFSKINVNGRREEPLYSYLKESLPGILRTKAIKWNFTKFLIDKNGIPRARFAPNVKPYDLLNDILEIL